MEEPFLYKDSEPILWTFSQVLELCKLAIKYDVADELASQADAQGIMVSVPKEAINFTKRAIFRRKLYRSSDPLKGIVASATCIPAMRDPGKNPLKDIPKDLPPDGGAPN